MSEPRRRLRLGMVGGGEGAFIGGVHRIAARIDDRWELAAGAFQSNPERSAAFGLGLGLPAERCYGDFPTMAKTEGGRSDRIDAVSIVTPNATHVAIARAFLEAGIAVICDKPLATAAADAADLAKIVDATGLPFVVTYNYSGYPMVRQARAMVEAGELGAVRIVQVEYAQDWLSASLPGNKQADWRGDPKRAGPGGALGDIGVHAFHLAEFVSGLKAEAAAADLSTFVPGRKLDDNVHVLLRFPHARGMLWASQAAPGNANGLRLRVYGEKAGIEWSQEQPDELLFSPLGEASRLLRRGAGGLSSAAARATRLPPGHPEGYLEGFAQIYSDAADLISAHAAGRKPDTGANWAPGIADGVRGVRFIEAVVASSRANSAWTKID